MRYERLSDSERRGIENKVYWMRDQEIKELEDKYGESFIKPPRIFDPSLLSATGKVAFTVVLAIGFGAVSTEMLSAVDLYHGPTLFEQFQHITSEIYSFWTYTMKPMVISFITITLKTIGISMMGHAGYEGIKEIVKKGPIIKINGKEITEDSKKQ